MSDDPDGSDGDGGSEAADQVDGGAVGDDERGGRRREEPSGDEPVGAPDGVDDAGAADAVDGSGGDDRTESGTDDDTAGSGIGDGTVGGGTDDDGTVGSGTDDDGTVGSTGEGASDAGSPIGGPAGDVDRLAADPTSEFEAPDGDLEDLFTEIEADDVDAEAVWAELGEPGSTRDGGGSGGDDRVEDPVDDAVLGEGTDADAVVSKASYCQRCEYFSGPPDVGCTHPGTRIVELVDVKRFRVRDCPVVAQRQGATVSSLERDDGYGSGGSETDDGGREYDGPRRARESGDPDATDAGRGDGDGSDDEGAVGHR